MSNVTFLPFFLIANFKSIFAGAKVRVLVATWKYSRVLHINNSFRQSS